MGRFSEQKNPSSSQRSPDLSSILSLCSKIAQHRVSFNLESKHLFTPFLEFLVFFFSFPSSNWVA
ncbi:hypothetical protein ZOSMA_74G01200 [Zostera marina]|uniref:Uncharacterized protein n=1 Tax=Zostera marina TaxID=29655 RepID=A0A0K9NPT4_ZOSMR|nr:hypothetical protein ZOSMA_74G01200 [Zostera marina]